MSAAMSRAWRPRRMAAWALPICWACTTGSNASASTARCWVVRNAAARRPCACKGGTDDPFSPSTPSPPLGAQRILARGRAVASHGQRSADMIAPFIGSSDLVHDGAALAARMHRDGYLFLPGLLPRADVAVVQRRIGDIARDAGWLRADHPIEAAIADQSSFCVDPDPTYLRTLRR